MNIVVVESPAKAKTINRYLGKDYTVLASYGHVRDLAAKDGSVIPEENFRMEWTISRDGQKHMKQIADAVKGGNHLYLATDPDREGEAIAWHVLEILNQKHALKDVEVKRVVFHEITKSAVLNAIAHPRDLDQEMIAAYLARRALDYLVGFTLSPVLWRKLPGARSAGRVQSVALRLVCDRELEIDAFVPEEYWTIDVAFKTAAGDRLQARLVELEGERLKKFSLPNEAASATAVSVLESGSFTVTQVESKPARRNPQPPFTTSTLQQEASRKLGFSATQTMRTAQRLYEGFDVGGETQGLITYMRTDSVQIASEAVRACRSVIGQDFGQSYVPEKPRSYSTRTKNAQEAHEAVRPVDPARRPAQVKAALPANEFRLYELIWKRTLASQMMSVELQRTTININSTDGRAGLRATGSVITFDGFLKLYQESVDEPSADDEGQRLPKVSRGEQLNPEKVTPAQHFTEPAPRYSEASLVKKLEELGIGRPSTYASTLEILRSRDYVHMERGRFIPEDKGQLVTAFLTSFFSRYVQYQFTADLEQKLDAVSAGEIGWQELLSDFWTDFIAAVDSTKDLRVTEVLDALNDILAPHVFKPTEAGGDPRACPTCTEGRLSLKIGKYGAFVGCSNYPECRFTRQLTGLDKNNGAGTEAEAKSLGTDPDSGKEIHFKTGRFGPFIEMAADEGEKKPKRASIPKDMNAEAIDLKQALALLALPRVVGRHPDSGEEIVAAIGRYGPYLLHDGKYARLSSTEEVFTVGLNRAVTLIAEAKTKGGRQQSQALRELGEHPALGGPIAIMDGRYGPYAKHGKINATLPRGTDPQAITLAEAVTLIEAKTAKGGKTGKPKARRSPARKVKS